jgi:hypothetical protein
MGLTSFNKARRLAAEAAEQTEREAEKSALEQTDLATEETPEPASEAIESALEQTPIAPKPAKKPARKSTAKA